MSEVVQSLLKQNSTAVQLVNSARPKAAVKLLQRTLSEFSLHPASAGLRRAKATTLNNLACAYKQNKQPARALQCLNAARSLNLKLQAPSLDRAQVLINQCACYSNASNHSKALECGLKALRLLEKVPSASQECSIARTIATYNVAAEYEHLRKQTQAVQYYQQAQQLAETYLCMSEPLAQAILEASSDALRAPRTKHR